METTDNTLREMQQQMKQLREKLESQKIVNDRLLRKACGQSLSRLRFKSNVPLVAGIIAILCMPAFHTFGISWWFIIFTEVMMLFCIGATLYTNRYIPRMNKDLVTAAKDLKRYRKITDDWIKIGIPLLIVWLGLLIWDFIHNMGGDSLKTYSFLGGVAAGIVLGGAAGLKIRRDQLDSADELIAQIEELQGE